MDRKSFQTGNLSISRRIVKFTVGKILEGSYPMGQVCGADVCSLLSHFVEWSGERERERIRAYLLFSFSLIGPSQQISRLLFWVYIFSFSFNCFYFFSPIKRSYLGILTEFLDLLHISIFQYFLNKIIYRIDIIVHMIKKSLYLKFKKIIHQFTIL